MTWKNWSPNSYGESTNENIYNEVWPTDGIFPLTYEMPKPKPEPVVGGTFPKLVAKTKSCNQKPIMRLKHFCCCCFDKFKILWFKQHDYIALIWIFFFSFEKKVCAQCAYDVECINKSLDNIEFQLNSPSAWKLLTLTYLKYSWQAGKPSLFLATYVTRGTVDYIGGYRHCR